MLIKKSIIIMLCAVFALALGSCGESHTAFERVPDADLGGVYFEHLVENHDRAVYVHSHLFIAHMKNIDRAIENILTQGLWAQYEYGYLEPFAEAYREWQASYPHILEIIHANIETHYRMARRITHHNSIQHFEAMKRVIDHYVSAVYINNPRPAPPRVLTRTETRLDEHGEEYEYEYEEIIPNIDLEYARANFTSFVCPDFLALNPHGAVADYLREHNIHVHRIAFDEFLGRMEHRIYPFQIFYRFTVFYSTGEQPEENERRWRRAHIRLNFYIGVDYDGNYIIKYISDPARER